jgi:bifunctional oligoribonuclease and PAP phosphatase NrnA
MTLNEKYHQMYEKIKAYKKIIITPHARPDGDCLGSALGLKDIIQHTFNEKEVYVSGESTGYLDFLGALDTLEDDVFKDALVIAIDTANKDRIAEKRFDQGSYLIKVDHHILVDSFGDLEIVDDSSPAAAQMVVDFYLANQDRLEMSPQGALALYTGILTDTGRFKYDGVSAKTFKAVAELYEQGLDPSITHKALDIMSEELIRFKGYVLLNMKKTENGVVYIKITDELRQEFKVTTEEASSLVNELGHFEDCPIWVLMAEYEEKIVRARIRSKGPTISTIANLFDGGGHAKASGANLGTWDKAEELLKALDGVAKEYKENQKEA